jgi:hypothetical protein
LICPGHGHDGEKATVVSGGAKDTIVEILPDSLFIGREIQCMGRELDRLDEPRVGLPPSRDDLLENPWVADVEEWNYRRGYRHGLAHAIHTIERAIEKGTVPDALRELQAWVGIVAELSDRKDVPYIEAAWSRDELRRRLASTPPPKARRRRS